MSVWFGTTVTQSKMRSRTGSSCSSAHGSLLILRRPSSVTPMGSAGYPCGLDHSDSAQGDRLMFSWVGESDMRYAVDLLGWGGCEDRNFAGGRSFE
jgi:hypothetical protein